MKENHESQTTDYFHGPFPSNYSFSKDLRFKRFGRPFRTLSCVVTYGFSRFAALKQTKMPIGLAYFATLNSLSAGVGSQQVMNGDGLEGGVDFAN